MLTKEFRKQFVDTAYGEFNDKTTRTKLQNMFTNIVCNEELNLPTVVNSSCIRFSLDNIVYEFSERGFDIVQ